VDVYVLIFFLIFNYCLKINPLKMFHKIKFVFTWQTCIPSILRIVRQGTAI